MMARDMSKGYTFHLFNIMHIIGSWRRVVPEEKGSVIHAIDTTGAGWIKFQPGYGDLLVADEAVTVFTSIHTTQRTVDFLQLYLPPARRFLCHLLGLQGVHPG